MKKLYLALVFGVFFTSNSLFAETGLTTVPSDHRIMNGEAFIRAHLVALRLWVLN